ncbi:MAG: hypothetical protein R3E96_15230 [Planctomycetota bacterium]
MATAPPSGQLKVNFLARGEGGRAATCCSWTTSWTRARPCTLLKQGAFLAQGAKEALLRFPRQALFRRALEFDTSGRSRSRTSSWWGTA